MRRRAVADIDPLVLGNAARPRLAGGHHDEAGTLVDRRIGDLELGIGEGDRAVVVTRRDHLRRADRLADPGRRVAGGDLGEPAPYLPALGLSFSQGLAKRGAQGVFVERVDIGRHDQSVALGIAHFHPVRGIAQRIDLLAALGCSLARASGAQRFGPGHQCDLDLARTDLVGGLVQQQDRTVAIGAFRLDQFGMAGPQRFGDRAAGVGYLRKGDLRNDADPVRIGQQARARIRLSRAQGIGHQRHRIAAFQRVFRPVVDLAHADNHRKQIGVHCINPCTI